MNDNIFFTISNSFINWMIKKHKNFYTFSFNDEKFPHYDINLTVTISDLRYMSQLQKLEENKNV